MLVSCLGSNDSSVDYPIDVTIRAFGLDTIYGKHYKFTIDQLRGEIYNIDSVPVGADTIINKILVDTLTAPYAFVLTGDTFFVMTDSVDFTKGPIELKLISAVDGVTEKKYTVEVRRHKQDPDSLSWSKMTENYSGNTANKENKIVRLNNKLLIYNSFTSVYSSSVKDGKNWDVNNVTVSPQANLKLNSILTYNDKLYALSDEDKVFFTEDGLTWTESALGDNVLALIAAFPDGIAAVLKEDDGNKFVLSNTDATAWQTSREVAPSGFPLENISATYHTTRTGIPRMLIVGKAKDAKQTLPWFSYDGKNWANTATATSYYIPTMERPSVMYYNDRIYAYGGEFKNFYVSDDAIIWKTVTKKFMFNEGFAGRGDYSSLVDEDNFIWIVWKDKNEVWRGRLNKLGFAIQ
ncbi:hypothetical protein D0T85_03480 [Bacteroides sp. 519]|nr:hypothetical protein [Bacteroides sp. 519]